MKEHLSWVSRPNDLWQLFLAGKLVARLIYTKEMGWMYGFEGEVGEHCCDINYKKNAEQLGPSKKLVEMLLHHRAARVENYFEREVLLHD